MTPSVKIDYYSKVSLISCALLSLVFAILKGTDAVDWSWWFILTPFVVLYTLLILICVILFLITIIKIRVLKKYVEDTDNT